MTTQKTPQATFLKDYCSPAYFIDEVELVFDLAAEQTRVHSRLHVRRNSEVADDKTPLMLDGKDLNLLSLHIDGEAVDSYQVDAAQLCINDVPSRFTLDLVNDIAPAKNTALEGLYDAGGMLCSQCEAEGFRRITYFPDRPDVMSRYRVKLIADKHTYPVLLSNGNPVAQGELDGGRHFAEWHDPSLKPCYLFAVVAGDLAYIEDRFTTLSGREVTLRIYTEQENIHLCDHAMLSLKQAMRWDEDMYGREYDLDLFMIVAVSRFNMGAMENKGLNLFNASLVLASPETAIDNDYFRIQSVIGHEYFHNWSGNRVTCRDWFQLSLKEGFTVFRDQSFSADMYSAAVERIANADAIRSHQFLEDAGPMAHPVRPESYIQVFNFYTATIYNKGAEVVRMLCNLLGWDDFRRGCDVYFARHDGQAVTCEDFVAAMEAVSGIDLTQFQRWYSQAGTPELTVRGEYDADNQRYTLHIAQHTPPTAKQPEKLPLHIPLAVGLLDSQGNDMPLSPRSPEAEGKEEGMSNASHFPQGEDAFTVVLPLRDSEHTFVFDNIPEAPIPSLLRNFSAPVKIKYERDENELAFLLAHDSDAFNRWDAGQQLAIKALLRQIEAAQNGAPLPAPERFAAALGEAMDDASIDKALLEAIMSLPESSYVADQCDVIDVDAIDAAYRFTRRYLAECLHERLLRVYQDNAVAGAYRFNKDDASRRGLRNTCLAYLANSEAAEDIQRCYTQFQTADNMSEIFPALAILCEYDVPERQLALDAFYDKWQHDEQVTLKWLGVQTANTFPDALTRVKQLMQHPAFDANNPNKIRAVIGGFCGGMSIRFHAKDGSGYDFIRGQILEQDKVNPKIAARLAHSLIRYKRYDSARAELMRTALENIAGQDNLSTDVYEVVNAGLEN